jgi:hypothetical protein
VGLSLLLTIGLITYSGVNLSEWLAGLYSGETKADHFRMFGFFVIWAFMAFFSVTKKLSLIPVLGLLVNLYLMTQMGATNWERFMYWCLAGVLIYFGYSYRKSKLNVKLKA